jgi:hypothetical protein
MKRRDPTTGLTDKELIALAEQAYDERDDPDAWEDEEPPEVAPDIRSVVSVRFSRGELEPIERAASAAGVPVSTYIRNAAIGASATVDVVSARRAVEALRIELESLARSLGSQSGRVARSARRRTA